MYAKYASKFITTSSPGVELLLESSITIRFIVPSYIIFSFTSNKQPLYVKLSPTISSSFSSWTEKVSDTQDKIWSLTKSISLFDNERALLNLILICNEGVKESSKLKIIKGFSSLSKSLKSNKLNSSSLGRGIYCKPSLTWGTRCFIPTPISAPKIER